MRFNATEMAALMVGGSADRSGLLHSDLYDRLEDLDRYCEAAGLFSTPSAVASVVVAWQIAHPGEAPIGRP